MATLVRLAGILFFLQRVWRSFRERLWKSMAKRKEGFEIRVLGFRVLRSKRGVLVEEVRREERGYM